MVDDPLATGLAVLHGWEEECRDLVAVGPFAGGVADWHTAQGLIFHDGILPGLLLRDCARQEPLAVERPVERAVLTALGRPQQSLPRKGAPLLGFRRRLRSALRAIGGGLRRRPVAAPEVLALCQDSQRDRLGGDDPFWTRVLPEHSHRLWHTVAGQARGRAWSLEDHFLEPAILHSLLGPMRRFRRQNSSWLSDQAWQMARRLQLPGIPASEELARALHALIRQALFYSALCSLAAERVLEKLRPRCLLLYTEFSAPGYQLLRAARRLSIRVVAVQHGDLVDGLSSGMLHSPLQPTVVPDVTCVFGQAYAKLLTDTGMYEGAEVVATGHLFRGLHDWRPKWHEVGPVLVLSQSFLSAAGRAAFFDSVSQIRCQDLQVKLHPYERSGLVQSQLPGGARIVSGSLPVFAAMDGARVVVGASSTALLEAHDLGFPVICIELPGERIHHEDLRAALTVVAAGEDPTAAVEAARPPEPDAATASFFLPSPSLACFHAVLARHDD